MAQNIKNQSGKEDNQKRHIVILIKDFLEYIYCVEELNTIKQTSKLLREADLVCTTYHDTHKVVKSISGKTKIVQSRESPLVNASFYYYLYRLIIVGIFIFFTLIMLGIFLKNGGAPYIKFCYNNIRDFAKTDSVLKIFKNIYIAKIIFGVGTTQFKKFVIPEISMGILWIWFMYSIKEQINNAQLIVQTKIFKELAIRTGLITEKRVDTCLWTPIGLFIDLENGTADGFVEDKTLWTQLSMKPGRVDTSRKSEHLVFVNVGFQLPSKIEYFYTPTGEKQTNISYQ